MKRSLRRASLVAKVFGLTLRVMAVWAVLAGGGQPAYATHFRYGHISWAPVSGTTIQFTIQNSFRRSEAGPFGARAYDCIDPATLATIDCTAADGLPGPGDVFAEDIGLTVLSPGDGSGDIGSPLGELLYVVTSIDPTNEWLFALALDPDSLPAIDTTITHTYPATGDFTAFIDSCCRISPVPPMPPFGINAHINNPDGGYRVETVVTVGTGNSSPVSALPPIVLCPINALCSFRVPGADPNGDPLRFRLSTASEASSVEPDSACPSLFCQPGPPFAPNAASISSTGLYTWNTTGATLGPPDFNTLYSTQVTIEDLDAAGNVKSKVAVDFFIQLVQIAGGSPPVFNNPSSAPVCGSTTPTPVNVGITQSFVVQASDPDPGQTVTLNAAGLPAGATMTPPLPTSGNPVSSTFAWTPTAADAGTYVITFTATDDSGEQAGLQTLCSMTLRVAPKNQPPDCRTAAPSPAELWPPNHKFVRIKVRGVTDPDGDPVTITVDSIFQDEPVKKHGTGSGNTCSDATGVGTSTARVRSERAGNPHVPGDGRVYHIRFTGDDGEGGTCTGEVRVCVPHDQRPRHRCGDQGRLFNSTRCP